MAKRITLFILVASLSWALLFIYEKDRYFKDVEEQVEIIEYDEEAQVNFIKTLAIATNAVINQNRGIVVDKDSKPKEVQKLINIAEESLLTLYAPEGSYFNLSDYMEKRHKPKVEQGLLGTLPVVLQGTSNSDKITYQSGVPYVRLGDLDFSTKPYEDLVYNGEIIRVLESELPVTQHSFRTSTLFNFEPKEGVFNSADNTAEVSFKANGLVLKFVWAVKENKVYTDLYVETE